MTAPEADRFLTLGPSYEPTAWLRQAMADHADALEAAVAGLPPEVTVFTLLNPCEPGSREDRTCDRCGVYVPPRLSLWVGGLKLWRPGCPLLLLGVGLCTPCGRKEFGEGLDQVLARQGARGAAGGTAGGGRKGRNSAPGKGR